VKVTEQDGVLSWRDHGHRLSQGLSFRAGLAHATFSSQAMTDLAFPRYVYKIFSEEPPNPLPHTLPLTPLDAHDGFIHLSAGWRVPETTALYFGSYTTVWLLRVDTEVARGEKARLEWGDPGCVHMYAEDETRWARMGDGIVVGVRKFDKGPDEVWENVMGDGWLS
jgi:uncharacterized protein (DUF952 family)